MNHQGLARLTSIVTVVSFLLVGLTALAPTASAGDADVDDLPILGPCNDPGYQWEVTGATYPTSVNSEWQGHEYHVYGDTGREEVWTYNFDLGAACVGGAWIRYGGSGSYDYCVNCRYVLDAGLLA